MACSCDVEAILSSILDFVTCTLAHVMRTLMALAWPALNVLTFVEGIRGRLFGF